MKVLMLVGALGAMLFGLTGCGSTTVDLNEYISVDISGYDSMGQANIRFDKDAFEEDFGDKIEAKINKQGGDAAKMSLELQFGEEPYEVMLNYCADYRLEKPDNLSNGDVVKLVWECETENAKEFFNCNLKYSDMEFKVEGLKELKTFNPFDYVAVEIEGVSPKGYASLVVDSSPEEMQYITFIADKLNDLSNKYLNKWTIDRLGNTDQSIIRMAIYELLYTNTPGIVVINEAVELAKSYSDDDVRKMSNASLDKLFHDLENEGK